MNKIWNWFDGKKTFTWAVMNLILPLIPGVKEWIAANPLEYAQLNGAIVAILRSMTKGPGDATPIKEVK